MTRQVVLDTETTGLEPERGHRIIEIGAVELIDRRLTGRRFHRYLQPDREIDAAAVEVHGITPEFLADKPRFKEIVGEFIDFVDGAELIIHNAQFDVSFINYELTQLESPPTPRVEKICSITDTLSLARHRHPGQKNSLDALCRRYGVDNSGRDLHGALLDAEILADVFLMMTGGQTALFTTEAEANAGDRSSTFAPAHLPADRPRLKVILPSVVEMAAHESRLDEIDRVSAQGSVARRRSKEEVHGQVSR
jgi:DNA polymerase-3 subunit epsilon